MVFITKLGPQVSLSPVPFFGVNICPFNYGIKVILFRNWPQTLNVFKSNLFNAIFPPVIRWSLHSDLNPRSPTFKLKPSMADQAIQVNFIPLRFIRYYLSDSHLRFIFPPFLDRSYPPSFWFTLRTTQHLISSVLWESLIPASSLKPNPGESPLKRLYQGPSCGKMLSRTGLYPQLQAGETGTRGYSQITVQKPAIGTPFVLPSV
jgi:hypothetical protein